VSVLRERHEDAAYAEMEEQYHRFMSLSDDHEAAAAFFAVMEVTGWRPHSVRGFLTAVVRKKLGLTLLSERPGEEASTAS
jgi:Protein of unknown function (DUF3489)